MKKALQIVLSWLLATSVLFASTGVVVASHICLKNNKSDVSLFESKSCCSKHDKSCSPVPVIKNNCCQLSISYHKLEVNSISKSASASDVVSVSVIDAFITTPGLPAFQNAVPLSDDPPGGLRLLAGSKNFLHSIQLLLI